MLRPNGILSINFVFLTMPKKVVILPRPVAILGFPEQVFLFGELNTRNMENVCLQQKQ